ncbi:MAG: hypothetical protein HN377_00710 [Alphaproteobacteria bacterium]|jgi:hypothetical protein|nr:hypothetical protein [Alphaproteobacteria bacterium]MBT7943825.1 hypothetical protein [Alphaproteobacteria bacterium]
MTDRPIIVHSLQDATAAVAVAAELGCPITLRSAPGAAAYLGPQVFRDMIEEASTGHDGATVQAVFDCGDDPGLALGALRHGLKAIRIDAPAQTVEKITDIAAQTGARVETPAQDDTPSEPATLDLLDLRDTDDAPGAIKAWLTKD